MAASGKDKTPQGKPLTKVLGYTELFHDRGRYHMEISPLIWRVNQWTGFYKKTKYNSVRKFIVLT